MKDLKKSNYLLKCDDCCDKYFKNAVCPVNSGTRPVPAKVCINCSSKIVKGEEILCICCFLQVKILNQPAKNCGGCFRSDKTYWIDAADGEEQDLILCGFCDEMKYKETVIVICQKCSDCICLVCLRKNPYVAQGICSNCHSRRQISLK